MSVAIEEYRVADAGAGPYGITTGADGALWLSLVHAGQIARRSIDGARTRSCTSSTTGRPSLITSGPDGALWLTESQGNRIARITTSGELSSFELPTPDSGPFGIVSGPDGALWFTEMTANRIGRLTPEGEIRDTRCPSRARSVDDHLRVRRRAVVHDEPGQRDRPDEPRRQERTLRLPTPEAALVGITSTAHRMWFAEIGAGQIGVHLHRRVRSRSSPFPTVTRDHTQSSPTGKEIAGSRNGQPTASAESTVPGSIAEFELPTPNSEPHGITIGSDRAVWAALEIGSVVRVALS